MSNSNATPASTAESIYQMLKERTLSQEAFGVDIDYVFTPSDRLETPLPLYVRRQADFEEASDEDIAQARIWFYRDNRVLLNIPYSPEGEESPKRSEYLLRVLGAAIAFIVPLGLSLLLAPFLFHNSYSMLALNQDTLSRFGVNAGSLAETTFSMMGVIVGGISLLRYLTGYIPDPVSMTSNFQFVLANGSILRHSRQITAIPEPPKPIVALWKRSLCPALIHLAIIAGILFAWILSIIYTFDLPISR